jgi:hypothetical protein
MILQKSRQAITNNEREILTVLQAREERKHPEAAQGPITREDQKVRVRPGLYDLSNYT